MLIILGVVLGIGLMAFVASLPTSSKSYYVTFYADSPSGDQIASIYFQPETEGEIFFSISEVTKYIEHETNYTNVVILDFKELKDYEAFEGTPITKTITIQ